MAWAAAIIGIDAAFRSNMGVSEMARAGSAKLIDCDVESRLAGDLYRNWRLRPRLSAPWGASR